MQHTQSALPPLPSLVNSMHPQQQQQLMKGNVSLSQQSTQPNMVQAQNVLNNNDVNQAFSTQAMNQGLSLSGLLGMHFWENCKKKSKEFWLTQKKCTKFSDNKNPGMPSMNPLMASMNTMNDKSMMNMLPNFDDPVEQSLASLEQIACKSNMNWLRVRFSLPCQ